MSRLAITLIVVLALTTVGGGVFSWIQTSSLGDAEDEIDTLEGDVATLEANVSSLEGDVSSLEGNVSTLEGNVATLETDLSESEATVATLQTDLENANSTISDLQGDLSTQRTLNSTLSGELKTVKDPRHFSSLQELTDWLREDDTDTKYEDGAYGDITFGEVSFILQVKALRDGYLLPTSIFESVSGGLVVYNVAVIGDSAYGVQAWDDYTERLPSSAPPMPSHPLPLD